MSTEPINIHFLRGAIQGKKKVWALGLQDFVTLAHEAALARGWWKRGPDGKLIERNTGELLALVHSEISEALEAVRTDAQDTHLPDRKGFEVELADAMLRILDIAGAYQLDLGGALVDKVLFNLDRDDHDPETRVKKF